MAGPFVQAFLGGAATTLTENIKRDEKIAREEEKNARELAATQAALLIENHTKVKDAREKQASKTKEDALFLKAQFPTVSNDDLVLAATNPSAVAALRARAGQPDWDPSVVKFGDFAKLTSTNTGADVDALVNNMYEMSVAKAAPSEANKNVAIAESTTDRQLRKMLTPLGFDVDELKASMKYKPKMPEGKVEFNLGVLSTPSYDAQLKQAKLAVVQAQQANDPVALEKASTKLSAFVVAEALNRTEPPSNEQIQSNLVTQIQNEKDPQVKAKLQQQLKQRQQLLAPPPVEKKITEADIRTDLANRILEATQMGDKRTADLLRGELKQRTLLLDKQETSSEKISAANLISASTKGVASAIQDVMTPGSFVVVTGADGSTTIQPKDLAASGLYKQGVKNGRTAVISQYTGSDGKPKSELHKAALISIGVVFDKNNVARLPNEEAPPAPVVTPAPAAPPAPPAPAKSRLSQQEFNDKWPTLKAGQSLVGPDGKTYTKK